MRIAELSAYAASRPNVGKRFPLILEVEWDWQSAVGGADFVGVVDVKILEKVALAFGRQVEVTIL